ncbi:hemophore-related protein [Nocardia arthritidis]|uniref:Hemophore-related protein n=1 Tax=Nocardia arthritidis TaxID=228602 RepID=A0A6G9YF14_9NOCA|nr:hemophore-related protein [Nocardia arthritidis]QIS11811.1 hemophore-related protein [Nocardia arthritidis]
MNRRKRVGGALLAAGVLGVTLVTGFGAGAAAADPVQCNPQARAQALAQSRSNVSAYLAGHPDVAAEVAKIKGLPKDQRKQERHEYFRSHPAVANDMKAALQPIRDYRQACHPK